MKKLSAFKPGYIIIPVFLFLIAMFPEAVFAQSSKLQPNFMDGVTSGLSSPAKTILTILNIVVILGFVASLAMVLWQWTQGAQDAVQNFIKWCIGVVLWIVIFNIMSAVL